MIHPVYIFFILGLVFAVGIICCSSEMARLYNSVTSSTLAWHPARFGDKMPENAVPIGIGGPFWCRSFHHSTWFSGAIIDGLCHVPFFGGIEIFDSYHVLVSVNGSARLINVPWDSLMALPNKPVATPDMLLAISNDAEVGAVLPGYVNPNERRAHFLQGRKSLKLTGGYLITEDEPIAYELTEVSLSSKTKRTIHEEILQEFTISNPTRYNAIRFTEISFLSPYQTYFGKVKGTLMGLNASVSGHSITPVNITWGVNNKLDERIAHNVSYYLPPESQVTAKLITVVRVTDGAYRGFLTSIYSDGKRIRRHIGGIYMDRRLAELRADLSEIHSIIDSTPIKGLSYVPEKTMILLHSSTTTTPLPTGIIADISDNNILPHSHLVSGRATCATNVAYIRVIFCISLSFLLK